MRARAAGAALQELLLWIGFVAERPAVTAPRFSGADLDRLLAGLDERFTQPLCMPGIGAEVGLSQNDLARRFRARMGATVARYALNHRIELARLLLTTTTPAVKAMGVEAGFPDSPHFNKQFRRFTGRRPSAARAILSGDASMLQSGVRVSTFGFRRDPLPRAGETPYTRPHEPGCVEPGGAVNAPSRSLVVCATPRTGSWLLSRGIEACGAVGAVHEWFVESVLADRRHFYGQPPDTPMLETLRAVVATESRGTDWFFVKTMWEPLLAVLAALRAEAGPRRALGDADLLRGLLPDPVFVLITRRDRVRQAVSYFKAMQTELWQDDPALPPSEPRQPVYSFDEIGRLSRYLELTETAWRQFLAAAGLPYHEVVFEELVANYPAVMEQLLTALEMPFDRAKLADKPIRPLTDDVNREWQARFEADRARRAAGPALAVKAVVAADGQRVRAGAYFPMSVRVTVVAVAPQPACGDWPALRVRWLLADGSALAGAQEPVASLPPAIETGAAASVPVFTAAPLTPGEYAIEAAPCGGATGTSARAFVTVLLDVWEEKARQCFADARGERARLQFNCWFGRVDARDFPWVWHPQHGWVCCEWDGARLWYWYAASDFGWFCADRKAYPAVWSDHFRRWLRFRGCCGGACRYDMDGSARTVLVWPVRIPGARARLEHEARA